MPRKRFDLKAGAGLSAGLGWEPRLTLSPSQLEKAAAENGGCMRAWALAYLYGVRKKFTAGAPVGLAMHWLLEQYHGDYGLEAMSLALPGPTDNERDLRLSPDDDQLARDLTRTIIPHTPPPGPRVFSETQFTLDTTPTLIGEPIQWEKRCAIDLIDAAPAFDTFTPQAVIKRDMPTVYDYKSTAGSWYRKKDGSITIKDRWAYVPTPHELRQDAQFNLYCADAWQTLNKMTGYEGPIRGSWIYASKPRPVMARTVTAIWEPKGNVFYTSWLCRARDLTRHKAAPPEDFRHFPLPVVKSDAEYKDIPCNKYGGCPYRYDLGGPCAGVRKADESNG